MGSRPPRLFRMPRKQCMRVRNRAIRTTGLASFCKVTGGDAARPLALHKSRPPVSKRAKDKSGHPTQEEIMETLQNQTPNGPVHEISFDPPDDPTGGSGGKLPNSASAGEVSFDPPDDQTGG